MSDYTKNENQTSYLNEIRQDMYICSAETYSVDTLARSIEQVQKNVERNGSIGRINKPMTSGRRHSATREWPNPETSMETLQWPSWRT